MKSSVLSKSRSTHPKSSIHRKGHRTNHHLAKLKEQRNEILGQLSCVPRALH